MKRIWIGVGCLLVVLILGIVITVVFARIHYPLSQTLEAAGEAALTGDWEEAEALARQAREDWDRIQHFTAAVADHQPMEEMDSLFAQLQIWEKLREREGFAVTCAALAEIARAIGDSQQLPWWNLL